VIARLAITASIREWRHALPVTSACVVLLVAFAGVQEANAAESGWIPRDAVIAFRNLPRAYSCESLTERVRAVLLRVGVRADVEVRPSRCFGLLGAQARSPRVRVRYFVPSKALAPAPLTISPGEPSPLVAGDCALVRQLMRFLPGKVTAYRLACRAPNAARPAFFVTIQPVFPPD
jgi:hypothetical protein